LQKHAGDICGLTEALWHIGPILHAHSSGISPI
jgi:hypothetical protein